MNKCYCKKWDSIHTSSLHFPHSTCININVALSKMRRWFTLTAALKIVQQFNLEYIKINLIFKTKYISITAADSEPVEEI